ncbi:MAG: hypothetical protein EOP48_21705 [Sphingobacteriales bacterium]|nr:MAG: hypothetical protein EOP48_21705 [Sphingobacteriales bacterium]
MLYQTKHFALFCTENNCQRIPLLIYIKQHEQTYRINYFQVWKFTRHYQTSTFDVEVTDGVESVKERLITRLPDVPFNELKVWCVDNVIMFPEDY